MREIKFRAWDIGRKFYEEVHDPYWFEENGDREQSQDGTFAGHHGQYIIEQFTGLKDRNGREIYEGDVVKGIALCDFEYGKKVGQIPKKFHSITVIST